MPVVSVVSKEQQDRYKRERENEEQYDIFLDNIEDNLHEIVSVLCTFGLNQFHVGDFQCFGKMRHWFMMIRRNLGMDSVSKAKDAVRELASGHLVKFREHKEYIFSFVQNIFYECAIEHSNYRFASSRNDTPLFVTDNGDEDDDDDDDDEEDNEELTIAHYNHTGSYSPRAEPDYIPLPHVELTQPRNMRIITSTPSPLPSSTFSFSHEIQPSSPVYQIDGSPVFQIEGSPSSSLHPLIRQTVENALNIFSGAQRMANAVPDTSGLLRQLLDDLQDNGVPYLPRSMIINGLEATLVSLLDRN
jgi:hypothetical protein